MRMGDRIDAEDLPKLSGERCASVGGVSLHANVAVPARELRKILGVDSVAYPHCELAGAPAGCDAARDGRGGEGREQRLVPLQEILARRAVGAREAAPLEFSTAREYASDHAAMPWRDSERKR